MKSHRAGIRVVGGALRGRRLKTPPGLSVRPTAQRVREALFDILGRKVIGAVVLDAYAGTGAVGIEAVSRGAAMVVFVEKETRVVEVLRANVRLLETDSVRSSGSLGSAEVIPSEVRDALEILRRRGGLFDVVFLDPPYGGGELDRGLRLISRSGVLKPDGLLIAEHPTDAAPPASESLRPSRTASYGSSSLTFYEKIGPGPASFDTPRADGYDAHR